VAEGSIGSFLCAGGVLEHARFVATEDVDSPLCKFLLESGWVINLEEYRSLPRRYDGLKLPAWLVEVPNAWLVVPLTTGKRTDRFRRAGDGARQEST
jgi:hypothetical protein